MTSQQQMLRRAGAIVVGALLGFGIWVVMIVVTSGVCSIPVLKVLWCTTPHGSVPETLTLWDLLLLPVFVGSGIKVLWETWT